MNNDIDKSKRLSAAVILLSTLAVIFMPQIINLDRQKIGFTNSFLAVFIWMLIMLTLKHAALKIDWNDKRGLVLAFSLAFFFSGAMLFGTQLENEGYVNFKDWKLWISLPVFTCFFGIFAFFAFSILEDHTKQKKIFEDKTERKHKEIISFMLMFFCWFIVFLAVYPGFFVYDATDEYVQVATRNFSAHHPLLHVLLLGGCICGVHKFTGSYNSGIALYTILQMLVAAGVLTGVTAYMRKRKVPSIICNAAVLYYALFPVIVMFVMCSSTVAIFTLAFLVLLLSLLHLGQDPEHFFLSKKSIICFWASAVVMLLFRPNGIYVFVLMIPVLIVWQKKYRKKQILILAAVLSVYFGINSILAAVLNADTSENQEMLTVPIQQLARTYELDREVFSQDDIEILHEILSEDVLRQYRPKLSDPVKYYFNNEAYASDPFRYISLWARIGIKKPLTYINAWLINSYGFWYPDTVVDVYRGNSVFTFTYGDSSYFGYEVEYPGTRESKIPLLDELYRKLSLEIYKEKIPIFSMLFSPGFVFWIFAFMMIYLLYRRRYKVLIPNILVCFLYLTVIFGPTYLPRYVLIFWFAMPVFAALFAEEL